MTTLSVFCLELSCCHDPNFSTQRNARKTWQAYLPVSSWLTSLQIADTTDTLVRNIIQNKGWANPLMPINNKSLAWSLKNFVWRIRVKFSLSVFEWCYWVSTKVCICYILSWHYLVESAKLIVFQDFLKTNTQPLAGNDTLQELYML